MATFDCPDCGYYIADGTDDADGFDGLVDAHEQRHRAVHETIATSDAQHALFVVAGDYGLGLQPGSFTTNLIRAIQHADPLNRALVAQAFPSLVRAVRMASGSVEALEALRTIVKDRTEAVTA